MRWIALAGIAAAGLSAPVAAASAEVSPSFQHQQLPPVDLQPPGPPPHVEPAPAEDACAADIVERGGILSLSFTDAARAGQQTTVTLDDIVYAARFDGQGRLAAQGPMFHESVDVAWTGAAGSDCHRRGIAFGDFQTAGFTALVWPAGPVDLALHVVEPDGSLGGPHGYVYPGRPNLDGATGLGELRTFGAPVAGTSRVQLYTLDAKRNPRAGVIYVYVEFVTRGNPARPPYCGGGPLAAMGYRILHLDRGSLVRRGGTFGTVPCGTSWSGTKIESDYFLRSKWGL